MSDFEAGEIVYITIRGRVLSPWKQDSEALLRVSYLGSIDEMPEAGPATCTASVNLSSDDVSVVRLAPAEWPPQAGDLWYANRSNSSWFAVDQGQDYGVLLVGRNGHHQEPDSVLEQYGPMTLVRRDGGEQS